MGARVREIRLGGRGEVIGLIFAGYIQARLSEPVPYHSPFRILVTFGQICSFRHPNFYSNFSIHILPIYLTDTFHLQYKHSGTFANRKYEELSYPKIKKMCDPTSSNSIENATPSSGTSPLATNKEVPPPPGQIRLKTDIETS